MSSPGHRDDTVVVQGGGLGDGAARMFMKSGTTPFWNALLDELASRGRASFRIVCVLAPSRPSPEEHHTLELPSTQPARMHKARR